MSTPHSPLSKLTKEQLLVQIDDLLRTMPSRDEMRNEESSLVWMGRLRAVIAAWSLPHTLDLQRCVNDAQDVLAVDAQRAYDGMLMLLHEARHDLVMHTQTSASIVVPHQATFEYFDGLRKVVEMAKQDVFFVDPYLDPNFVAKYLPHVTVGAQIRLLARHKLPALVSAAEAFAKQHGCSIEVRSSERLHDRYVFVDQRACYQSGASFKDGAKSAPTTITEITDAFDATLQTFETLWKSGKVEL